MSVLLAAYSEANRPLDESAIRVGITPTWLDSLPRYVGIVVFGANIARTTECFVPSRERTRIGRSKPRCDHPTRATSDPLGGQASPLALQGSVGYNEVAFCRDTQRKTLIGQETDSRALEGCHARSIREQSAG
jgi:hypothetical protein